jgi:hypothetical protein
MRGGLALLVHDSLGQSLPHFPLYIAEALCVEAAAMLIAVKQRPAAFGALAGVLIGTVGLAAEWGWSHVWMPLPWPAEILPETIVLGLAMAISASLLGAWVGARLDDEIPYTPSLRPVALVTSIAIFAMIAFPLFTSAQSGVGATVALTEAQGAPQRTVNATITLAPRDAADGAKWFTVTAWQGDGRLVVDRLERVAEGVYRTTKPIPVHGSWKANVRLHKGNSLVALPIYAPRDTAIPVAGIPAPARFERSFQSDKKLLQREAKTRNDAITYAGYGTVLGLALLLIAMLAWGIHRVAVTAGRERDTPLPDWAREPEPEPEPERLDAELPAWARPCEPVGNGAGAQSEWASERETVR